MTKGSSGDSHGGDEHTLFGGIKGALRGLAGELIELPPEKAHQEVAKTVENFDLHTSQSVSPPDPDDEKLLDPEEIASFGKRLFSDLGGSPSPYMVFCRQMEQLKQYVPEDKLHVAVLDALKVHGITAVQIVLDITQALQSISSFESETLKRIDAVQETKIAEYKRRSDETEQTLAEKQSELKRIQEEILALQGEAQAIARAESEEHGRLNTARQTLASAKQQWVFDLNSAKQRLEGLVKGG